MELEGPQEVRGGLEVLSHSIYLVNDILDALQASTLEAVGHHTVVRQRHSLSRDLSEAALVDKLLRGLEVGVSVCDERLDKAKHLGGSGVDTHEDTVVDLSKTEQLKDLLDLGGNIQDTSDTNDKNKLLLVANEDLAFTLGNTTIVDGIRLDLVVKRCCKVNKHNSEVKRERKGEKLG